MTGCIGKKLYVTEDEALHASSVLRKRFKNRVYECELCKAYHITSRVLPDEKLSEGEGGKP